MNKRKVRRNTGISVATDLGINSLVNRESSFFFYQITGLSESPLTIGSPGLQPNAAANCGMFESGPLVLQIPGECGSVLILTRSASGRMF